MRRWVCVVWLGTASACVAPGPPAAGSARPPAAGARYDGPPRDWLEAVLRRGVPDDLEVAYSDTSSMYGGEIIIVNGSGEASVERHRAAPEKRTVRVARGDLERLTALLVEIEVWEQREPDREPVFDESRAALRVRTAGKTTLLWERYNDMEHNQRLVRVRALLEALVGGAAPR